jgi:hypothetical protein
MKSYQSKHTKNHTQNPNNRSDHEASEDSLEKIAEELTELALKRLPDGVLRGILTAQEEDIRQQAILLALTWYLQGDRIDPDKPVEVWHAPRAIAGALQIVKRDTIKELLRKAECQYRMPVIDTTTSHPVMVRACDWPTPVMRDLCREAIRVALCDRRISALSAAVAEAVYVHGIHVSDLAKRRKVHRSSIYQQLSRAQPHLREIIETIEVALVDVM